MTTHTATSLTDFLLARIEDDEAAARAASPDERRPCVDPRSHHAARSRNAAHIARHDPARVLAECAAKRAIVDLHWDGRSGEHVPPFCATCSDDEHLVDLPCPTLCALASVYADCDGFDERWAVS